MIRFNNDYNHGAHPAILEALSHTNDTQFSGYGTDEWCEKAEQLILDQCQCPQGRVYFFPGATQANLVTIDAFLGSCDSVICAVTGHINGHECASIENTGHKILALPQQDGKITAGQIEKKPGPIMKPARLNGSPGLPWSTFPLPPNMGPSIPKQNSLPFPKYAASMGWLFCGRSPAGLRAGFP